MNTCAFSFFFSSSYGYIPACLPALGIGSEQIQKQLTICGALRSNRSRSFYVFFFLCVLLCLSWAQVHLGQSIDRPGSVCCGSPCTYTHTYIHTKDMYDIANFIADHRILERSKLHDTNAHRTHLAAVD